MLDPENFHCKQCGRCCFGWLVLVSQKDIKRLRKAGYDEKDILDEDKLSPGKHKFVLKTKNNKCIFLDKKKGKYYCKIYDIRPLTCQRYPFFKKNVENCDPKNILFKK